MNRRDIWLGIRCSLVLILLALAGCDSSTGEVKGRVTFHGKPVVFGSVVMLGADNKLVSGPLDAEGRYAMSGVSLGTVQVAVVSPNPAPPPPPPEWLKRQEEELKLLAKKMGKALPTSDLPTHPSTSSALKVDRRQWFALPKQYELADTSGITTTIHCGDNTFDIELK